MTDERGEILRPIPDDARTTTSSRMGRFLTAALGRATTAPCTAGDPEAFWRALVAFFDVEVSDLTTVLVDASMPGGRWLPGARVSYSAHALRPECTGLRRS